MSESIERLRLGARALIVTGWFPPRPGGSAAVLGNLLRWIHPADYVVATARPPAGEPRTSTLDGADTRFVLTTRSESARGAQLWKTVQIPFATARVVAIARRERCRVIVGVFPDLQLMAVAYLVHRATGLPLVSYFHDFMIEAGYGGYLGALARWLQPRVLSAARPAWTMSVAMTEHIARVYRVPTEPLVHAYNDRIPDGLEAAPQPMRSGVRVLFSGAVYAANDAALARVVRALSITPGNRLTITGPNDASRLAAAGVAAAHVEALFLRERAEVVEAMQQHDILLVALSWPDESSYGPDELATIFSTKLPEYLAQGKPILVHCPEHYYLARFCREHDCAWVVADRSETAVQAAIEEIVRDPARREQRQRNALAAARQFAGERVARQFADGIRAAAAPVDGVAA